MHYNIGIVIEIFYPEINGVVTTTMNLAHNLKKLGHNPFIITPKLKDLPDIEKIDGITIYRIPSRFIFLYPGLHTPTFKARKVIRTILAKEKTHLIHTTASWNTCKLVSKIARELSIPSMQTVHTNLHSKEYMQYVFPIMGFNKKIDAKLERFGIKFITKLYMRYDSLISSPSNDIVKLLECTLPKKDIIHIPNGIDVSSFNKYDKNLLNDIAPVLFKDGRKHKKYALYIGRLAKEKSIAVLLYAVNIIVKTHPEFLLILIGDGPAKKNYQNIIKKLNIQDNVFFAGKHDHKTILDSGILKNARCFVTASTSEAQSMTAIEAICSEIPLILAKHYSMQNFLEDIPIYAEPHNPHSFATALLDIMTNEPLYKQKCFQSKALKKRFDGEKIVQQYIKAYKQIAHA